LNTTASKIQDHYDDMAEVYDNRYDANLGKLYYAHICSQVMGRLSPGGRLLDLGCGTGLFSRFYSHRGGRVVGLDISRGMIEKARENCAGGEFVKGTAEMLPFEECTFDGVSSLLAFSYLRDPDLTMREVFRVLKPGGSMAICTLGLNLFTRGLPALYQLSEAINLKKACFGAFGERYYSVDEMEQLLIGAGFEEIQVRRCSFAHYDLAPPIYHIAKKVEPFVERNIPYLAYNICASGKKPDPGCL